MSQVCSALRSAELQVRDMPGTYIGNLINHSVIYTPPVGSQIILYKLNNLAEFMNDEQPNSDGEILDPLIRMAISHYLSVNDLFGYLVMLDNNGHDIGLIKIRLK